MATTTAAVVKTRFPEFDAVANTRVDLFIAEATRELNETQWGGKFDDGVLWFTAHLLADDEAGASGGGGPVKSEKTSRSSVSYAVTDVDPLESLATTKYGRRYLDLLSQIFATRVLP